MSTTPLISSTLLLRAALRQYRAHAQYLITLFAIPFALTALAFVSSLGAYRPALSFLGGLIALGAAIAALCAGIGLVAARAAGAMGESITATFRRSYPLLLPFLWVTFITLFVFLGSFSLLIIPGLIISVLLSQTVFTCIVGGTQKLDALLASWQLVRAHFWQVLGRLVVLWIVTIIVAGIVTVILSLLGLSPTPSLGVSGLSELARAHIATRAVPAMIIFAGLKLFVLTPFAILFLFELYKSLTVRTTDLPQLTEESLKKRRVLLIVCGVIGILALLVLIIFSRVLFNYAVQALELSGGPNRDFVQTLTELRSLSPQQVQTLFTKP